MGDTAGTGRSGTGHGGSAGLVMRVALTAGLLALVLWRLDPARFLSRIAGSDPAWIAASFGVVLAAIAVSAFKWGAILAARSRSLPYARLLRHYFVGLFFNNVLPTTVGGDAVRAWETTRDTGEVPEAAGSVLSERLIAGVSLGVTALVGLAFVERTPTLVALVIGFLAVDVALAAAFVAPRFAERVVRGLLVGRLAGAAGATADTVRAVRGTLSDIPLVLRVAALSVVFQILVAGVNACIFRALGVPVTFGECIVYTPMIFTVTMVPISLSGLGVREAAYWYFFSQAGVDQAAAVTASLLFFVIVGLASLPGAPLFALARPKGAAA